MDLLRSVFHVFRCDNVFFTWLSTNNRLVFGQAEFAPGEVENNDPSITEKKKELTQK